MLSRAQKIDLIRKAATSLANEEWSEIDLVLRLFGFTWTDSWEGTKRDYCLTHLQSGDDSVLVELDDYLRGRLEGYVPTAPGPWRQDTLRLFLSHLAAHERYVDEVKNHLSEFNIDAFVAHRDIGVSDEWQNAIETALSTCDALAAFLHPGFNSSLWVDQEVGFCIPRRVPIVPLMLGVQPYGFMSRYQGVFCEGKSAREVAMILVRSLGTNQRTRGRMQDAVISALARSGSFADATERALLVEQVVEEWTSERIEALEEVAGSNSQIRDSWHAMPIVHRILSVNQPPAVPTDDIPF